MSYVETCSAAITCSCLGERRRAPKIMIYPISSEDSACGVPSSMQGAFHPPGSGSCLSQYKRPSHIRELDGLRGIAVLMVMAVHSFAGIRFASVGALFSFGWAGVDLFFVLSGFLITRILVAAPPTPGRIRNFYARRALRIVPLYVVFLVLVFSVGSFFNESQRYDSANLDWWPFLFFVQNLTFATEGLQHSAWPLCITWSLAIEEQFYLVWPILVFRFRHAVLVKILVAAWVTSITLRVVLLGAGITPDAVYYLTATRLDGLAAGGLLALLYNAGLLESQAAGRACRWAVVALPVALFISLWFLRGEEGVLSRVPAIHPTSIVTVYSLYAIGFAAIIAVLLTHDVKWLRPALNNRAMRAVGTISYGLYLIHYPLFELFRVSVAPRFAQMMSVASWVGTGLAMVSAYVLTFALAAASWRMLESPILSLRRKLGS